MVLHVCVIYSKVEYCCVQTNLHVITVLWGSQADRYSVDGF